MLLEYLNLCLHLFNHNPLMKTVSLFCGLFIDAISMEVCRCLRSGDVIGKLEGIWKEGVVLYSIYCLGIYREGLRRSKEDLCTAVVPDRDSNQAPPEFVLRALLPTRADVFGR